MAKEANFGFLAIFSGTRPFSLPCSRALFLQTCSLAAALFSRVAGSLALHRAPLNELAPCITRLFSRHLACPVPEKGVSGTEYLFRTGKACFLHRMPLKMRRVPQEPVFCTARIFRTVGGPLRYRMPPGHQTSPIRIPPNTTTQHNAQTKPSITTLSPQPSTTSIHNHPNTKQKEVPTECYFNRDFRKAAAAYSPTWWGSTIGASELNFSVRYGKRWILTAITAAVFYLREIS